ncbi:PREDICTED: odorant receptor 22c-like [Dinoponera quadriceps]|uniref:Odorant receptor 22c-like n=1 Tax=Dinoponera quadriceps TaxID=609295 RepID=A0A6P3XPE2_DINQU|nr:PREDICTED: odorant receptor 22c-like [Dinoponera quadriceps]
MMTEDWKDCANNDSEMYKAVSKAKLSDYIVNATISLHTVAVFFYCINTVLDNVDITDPTIEIPHIYKMEFPLDIKTQSTYKFVLIIEMIHVLVSSWGLGILNVLLLTLALDTPDATEKIMRSLSYYSVTNLEAFIFCYAGEYLINKSKAIGYAAYNAAWYNMEPKHSRILWIIILRSQKELTLTIGKLMDLSLRRFASIMNSAGSYISVLLAMQ